MIDLFYEKIRRMYQRANAECPTLAAIYIQIEQISSLFGQSCDVAILELLRIHTKKTYWISKGVDYGTLLMLKLNACRN